MGQKASTITHAILDAITRPARRLGGGMLVRARVNELGTERVRG